MEAVPTGNRQPCEEGMLTGESISPSTSAVLGGAARRYRSEGGQEVAKRCSEKWDMSSFVFENFVGYIALFDFSRGIGMHWSMLVVSMSIF